MTPYDMQDQVLQHLALLPPLTPDPARTARVQARCRTQLVCIQRRSQARFGQRVLAPAVVLGLCALYFASLLRTALTLRGVL